MSQDPVLEKAQFPPTLPGTFTFEMEKNDPFPCLWLVSVVWDASLPCLTEEERVHGRRDEQERTGPSKPILTLYIAQKAAQFY